MKLIENISNERLNEISEIIGQSFVTNNLFNEFGNIEERRELVLKYMKAYVKCVYESKALYQSDDNQAFIGLSFSDKKAIIPQLKLLFSLVKLIPFKINKRFLKFIKEIENEDTTYTKDTYLEVLMVCVSKQAQGKGRARELVAFAKKMAESRNVPLLFDTDMKEYSDMYQHFGCELYHKKTSSNNITRYNLVWNPKENISR